MHTARGEDRSSSAPGARETARAGGAPAAGFVAAAAWTRIARGVARRLPRVSSYVVYALQPTVAGAGALARMGFQLEEITPGNVDLAASFRDPSIVAQLRSHLAMGDRGWYALQDGEVTGYAFLTTWRQSGGDQRASARLYPGEASVILGYNRPEYRGRGMGTALFQEILAVAASTQGVRNVVTWTHRANKASQRVQAKAGGRRIGWFVTFEGLARPLGRYTFGSPLKR